VFDPERVDSCERRLQRRQVRVDVVMTAIAPSSMSPGRYSIDICHFNRYL
jgi:hypothetical protein